MKRIRETVWIHFQVKHQQQKQQRRRRLIYELRVCTTVAANTNVDALKNLFTIFIRHSAHHVTTVRLSARHSGAELVC